LIDSTHGIVNAVIKGCGELFGRDADKRGHVKIASKEIEIVPPTTSKGSISPLQCDAVVRETCLSWGKDQCAVIFDKENLSDRCRIHGYVSTRVLIASAML
jgi:hypothetical protein